MNSDTDPAAADGQEPESDLSSVDEEGEIETGITQSYKTFDLGSTPSGNNLTPDFFEKFKSAVFASRPSIATLYDQCKDTPLYTYAKTHVRENRNKVIRERKSDVAAVMHKEVRRTLGSTIADRVSKQLKTNDSASTVQKNSPLSHPDTFNATLMNALPYFGAQHPSFASVLILSCAGISFNNTKFPRGHLFHSFTGDEVYTNTLTFFGHTVDSLPLLYNPPYTSEGITEIKNSLQQLKRENKLTDNVSQKIHQLIEEIYAAPHAMSATDYVDQVTITNYYLFKKLFSRYPKHTPSLVYLSQEKVALSLLLDYHLDQDTIIHRILFDSSITPLVEKYFDGLTGAFVKNKKIGTYLFWGIPSKGKYRTQLWSDGSSLKSEDGSISIELTPERIREAILTQQVFPSILLTFLTLALYYGLILGGGYEQTFYLTKMKERYASFLDELSDTENHQALEGLVTTNLVIPRPLMTYLEGPHDARIPATGFDMVLYGDEGKSWNKILEATKQVTMGQIIERTLPSLFREYAVYKPQSDDFTGIMERDVERFTSLDKTIPTIQTHA